MIIWRIRRLTDQLRTGEFSARQVLPYLVAATLWASMIFVFSDWSRPWDRDDFETAVDSLTTLVNGVISAFGLYWCYKANGGAEGSQLAERICALGVVLFLRFLTISVLAFVVWVYAAVNLKLSWRPTLEDFDLLSVLLVALFWVRLRHHVRSAAQPLPRQSNEEMPQ